MPIRPRRAEREQAVGRMVIAERARAVEAERAVPAEGLHIAGELHDVVAHTRRRLPVAVVDDQELVRAGFVALLAGEPDFSVAGEAGQGEEAREDLHQPAADQVRWDDPGAPGHLRVRIEFLPRA